MDCLYGWAISFHQENLSGPEVREEMKFYWEKALEEISQRLNRL
jgi:hypothetical protein